MGERKTGKNTFLYQWVIYWFFLLALAVTVAVNLNREYERTGKREQERLETQARVIAGNLGFQLKTANLALEDIVRDLPYWNGQSGRNDAIRSLRALCDAMPGMRTIIVTDAAGTVLTSNRTELISLNVAHRSFFKSVRQAANAVQLHVSTPYKTVLGVFSLNLVRMIPGKNGQFAGIVSTTLDPDYFTPLLNSVLYSPDMRTEIAHWDGTLFLMNPSRGDISSKNLAQPGASFNRHCDSGQETTVYSGSDHTSTGKRLLVWHTIRPAGLNLDKPLLVAVSRDLDSIRQTWLHDVYMQAGMFGLMALIATTAVIFCQRRQQTYDVLSEQVYKGLEDKVAERTASLTCANKQLQWVIDQRLRVEQELLEHQKQLESMALELSLTEERERLSISRELHDEMGQTLTALKLDLSWFELKLDGPELTARMNDMKATLDELIVKTRHISAELRPPLLDHLGLTAAIEWQLSEFERRSGITAHLMLNEDVEPLIRQASTMILRILQEALTNVIRHAEASEVSVSLCKRASDVVLEIADNGRGAAPEEISSITAYGLMGMRERARLCRGTLLIEGSIGVGTTVRLTIPFEREQAA